MNNKTDKYIPAVRFDRLTSIYDPLIQLIMPEKAFKSRMVEQMHIKKGYSILDVGCGTATLAILIKKSVPEAVVTGLDGDENVLRIATEKVKKEGVNIKLDKGMSFELSYPDNSFDRVTSSLVFHHLTKENKLRTFKEIYRVLKPDGELHVLDIGKPQNILMLIPSLILRWFEEAGDNIRGLLPDMFRSAGFAKVEETRLYMTIIGTLTMYRVRKTA